MGTHRDRLEQQLFSLVGKKRSGGDGTRDARNTALRQLAAHAAKCGLQNIRDYGTKEMRTFFEQRGQEVGKSQLAKIATVAREFARAIGKQNIVPRDNSSLGALRTPAEREQPKSGQLDQAKYTEVRAAMYERAEWLGLAADLRGAFGARSTESLLNCHVHDERGRLLLDLDRGTKGGRPRVVTVETVEQRAVVAAVRDYLERTGHDTLIPKKMTLEQAKTMQRNAWGRAGGTKKNNCNMHQSRHEYAGWLAKQGHTARQIAESLGHGREAVVAHYCKLTKS